MTGGAHTAVNVLAVATIALVHSPHVACPGELDRAGISSTRQKDGARRSASADGVGVFADMLRRLNGDIFWAPASASSKPVTRFGDEARAVFGPIPDGDCGADTAVTIPVEVDGNIVELRPNPGKPETPLEFEHRDAAGNSVKWTTSIPRCDKPSLTGSTTYCGLASRLYRVVEGDVEWSFLCRKSNTSKEVGADPYWQRSNPEFALFGAIGFNRRTGEIVFFDGRKDRGEFDWTQPFVPPGGHSYADKNGRAKAETLYDPTFRVQCSQCHDNKRAHVISPHVAQARVGYFSGENDERAKAFGLGNFLPETPRAEFSPFRVVGSEYTRRFKVELGRAKTVRDPTGNCTSCHTLTTQVSGQRFAADAVAQEPWISNPTQTQDLLLRYETLQYARIAAHRTDWALRSGPGKIHPWMVPGPGNELSDLAPGMSLADWRALSDCLWDAGGDECGYRPLYTPCPSPGTGPQGDGFAPTALAAAVFPESEPIAGRLLRISWKYLNGYGNVSRRDDVRFDLAVRETKIPPHGRAPAASDYPEIGDAATETGTAAGDIIGIFGRTALIRNVSFAGHIRNTDPPPSSEPREYKVDVPATCNRRQLVRIAPKRFCFDQSNIAYDAEKYEVYLDVYCN